MLYTVNCILYRREVIIARVMGLDVGDARIGVALSDPLGIIASPLKIITRDKSPAALRAILGIVTENGVARIIVGLPANMDGTLGSQAEKVQEFVKELKAQTPVPVEFRDERLTTVQAKRILKNSRKTTRDTRFDAAAAALILQTYLDDALPPKEYQEHETGDTE
jgi:putative Holliday junction resolvase